MSSTAKQLWTAVSLIIVSLYLFSWVIFQHGDVWWSIPTVIVSVFAFILGIVVVFSVE